MCSNSMVSVSRPVCVSRQTLSFKTSQGYVSDARWYDFSYRTHDFEPFASSCFWPSKSPDLNPIKRYWDAIGRVVRRQELVNVRQFTYTAISNGRLERNYTAHVECLGYMYVTLMRSRCQTVIEANGGNSMY